jgi:hypothetical protein
VLAVIVRQHLAERRRRRSERAAALLAQYLPVVRAAAARWFSLCKGAVPLDELQSVAYEEALKGAHRFDPTRRNETGQPVSPAPLLRRWADFGCQALVTAALQDQDVRPDQDEDGSRWERLGEADERLAQADGGALRGALAAFAGGLGPAGRRVLQALLRGEDDDQAAARGRGGLALVDEVRAQLAAHLAAQGLAPRPDAELTPAEVARRFGLTAKVVYKGLASGALPGRRRDGGWLVREADAAAFARRRAAPSY